jgi:phosphohistidine phosphatase
MRLYFLRHGGADWPQWKGKDDDRPLNDLGVAETRRVAKGLRRMQVSPDVVISSPLPRAGQTARIVAAELGAKLVEEPALAPGCTAKKLFALLELHPLEEIMVVGHEPDFSKIVGELTGARVKIAKAGVALVDLDSETLVWLFPPKVMPVTA